MQTRRKTICGETMAAPKNILFHEFVQKGDWEFNAMLLKIAMKLDQEDVRRLKFLLSGPNGVSTREMERLTTAEEFFMCLKQRMMLTRDNLLVLQAFLTHLQRKDLREITEDYGRKIGNTLFFYEPPHQPGQAGLHEAWTFTLDIKGHRHAQDLNDRS
ncbi:poly [ADP-ribose] polymerase [Plakobranchus ocellatus]|uniref:Poly [ADP-ribose] polymerase n=1 Tax=Plakobranchus ocellatus TaxID=259542 RepID=A0AAV4C5S7_9GAST|nr:poly [ADP-ribose] polymerase [Plakobranchus ocellatus]